MRDNGYVGACSGSILVDDGDEVHRAMLKPSILARVLTPPPSMCGTGCSQRGVPSAESCCLTRRDAVIGSQFGSLNPWWRTDRDPRDSHLDLFTIVRSQGRQSNTNVIVRNRQSVPEASVCLPTLLMLSRGNSRTRASHDALTSHRRRDPHLRLRCRCNYRTVVKSSDPLKPGRQRGIMPPDINPGASSRGSSSNHEVAPDLFNVFIKHFDV